jgi:hypothetical protein
MDFQLKDILTAIGPTASIVFAAWISVTVLQERYTAAFQRYRSLIQECRDGHVSGDRHANVREQVLLYKRRFEMMGRAINLGLLAAILLITTLIGGALNVVFPNWPVVQGLSTGCAMVGFILVILAAVLVIRENSIVKRALAAELLDLPELAEMTGNQAGYIGDSDGGR